MMNYLRLFFVLLISAFFMYAGIKHFVDAEFFTNIMPDYLGYHLEIVYISGVFEVLGAIGLLIPTTRRWAGIGLMALCIAVLPANIHMLMNPERFAEVPYWLLVVRIPIQFLLIWLIYWSSVKK